MTKTRRQRTGEDRGLRDLVSVGPATLGDFETLGIRNVEELAQLKPATMYERLCQLRGTKLDICTLDVFEAAVAQARDPDLPAERRNWWWWSRRRKAGSAPKDE